MLRDFWADTNELAGRGEVPGSYRPYGALSSGETVEDLGDRPPGGFGDRDYPEVRVKCSLKDFDDQKTLAICEPSKVGVELRTHLDVDLLDPAGATTGAAIGIPGSTKCADRRCR